MKGFLPALLVILLSSCSTLTSVGEDEQLYVGVEKITFNQNTEQQKLSRKQRKALERKKKHDIEAGVITAVAESVETLSSIINGAKSDTPAPAPSVSTSEFSGRGAARAEARAEKIRVEQMEAIREEVEAVFACPPNGSLFGSNRVVNPLNLGLRVYNKYSKSTSRFGKWMLRRFGKEPKLISTVAPDTRVKVAANQLHNYGYFRAQTSYDVLPQKNPRKARIAYHVQTGPLFFVDSIRYESFTPDIDRLLRRTRRQSFLKKGVAFSSSNLVKERTRIEETLREKGYYYFNASDVAYAADTINHPLYVSLRVMPQSAIQTDALKPWQIGHMYVTLYDNTSTTIDSVLTAFGGQYAFHGPKPPVKARLWQQSITHRIGQPYSLTDERNTLQKLSSLGIFSHLNVDYLPTSVEGDTLDIFVTATMDKLYESSFAANVTLKSSHQVGPGISYELSKKNAFRAGEKVAWKIYGQYDWYYGRGVDRHANSFDLGSELSLSFPRLLLPKKVHQDYVADTKVALDIEWKNRSHFFNMLQFGAGLRYAWHRNARLSHEFVPIDIELSRTFSATPAYTALTQSNPVLGVSMRNQVLPTMSYVYTFATSSSKDALWVQVAAKEAGNLTNGIIAAMPSHRWGERDKILLGSPYAQYGKLTLELHRSWVLSKRNTIASRFFGGVAYSYANSVSTHYSDLFYAGGANSVRAFAARSIGPGGFRDANRRNAYISQMGDAKFEANLEWRARLFADLHAAVFLDAGNVWLLRKDELRPQSQLTLRNLRHTALGTGFGLRYDLSFLVLRVDVGVGLHAPYATSRSGFYNIPRFRDGCALHLAIGYPF